MTRLLLAALSVGLAGSVAVAGDDDPKRPLKKPLPAEGAKPNLDQFGQQVFQRMDANGDGKISKAEAKGKLAERFDEFDANKDGFLDPQEFRQMLGKLMAAGAPQRKPGKPGEGFRPDPARFVEFFLKQHDKNGDAKLSKDEAPEKIGQFFDRLDKNGDGFLDKEELKSFAERMMANAPAALQKPGEPGKRPGEGDKPASPKVPDFDRFDQDADGRLTKDELKDTPFAGVFDTIDRNKDGKIDPEEWAAHFKAAATK